MRLTLLLVVVLLGVRPAMAAELPPDLSAAVSLLDRATVRNDVATLRRLVSDDYMLVNSDGSVEDKARYLADFHLPGFRIEPYVLERPVRKVWGDAAVIAGLIHLHWTQDGKRHARRVRMVHVWARRGGRWQLTHTQVTRVPD